MLAALDMFFYFNIPITIASVLFFIYSNIKISDYEDSDHQECRDFLIYNITHLILILMPLVVMVFFVCCNKICSSVLYIGNAFLVLGQLVEKYAEDKKYCTEECQEHCSNLVDFSEKINICLIVIGVLYILSGLGFLYKLVKCCG